MKSKTPPLGRRHLLPATLLVVSLAGCAVGPAHQAPTATATLAPTWSAPQPHSGALDSLVSFWQRWNDPALVALIDSAQKNNPTLEQASARIAAARASVNIAGASALPSATGNSAINRGNAGTGVVSTIFSGSLQAAWELDLFGANQRARDAASARFAARSLDWHDARVSLAAEVATVYTSLRVNQLLLQGFDADVASRTETARLTALKVQAGFEAPANGALASASVSEAKSRVAAQSTELDLGVKALVALSGLTESAVRAQIATRANSAPKPPALGPLAVPAATLAQRPDLASIERELAAAIADIGAAEADRYPRITLSGSIGYSASRAMGATSDGATWGFGPAISIPLFDAGRRIANVDLAKARHAELTASYKAAAVRAVREVEEALTRIDSVRSREADLNASLASYTAFANAAAARLTAGVGSVLELQEARRAVLAAQVAVVQLERERAHAWISLYRAVGGGWTPA